LRAGARERRRDECCCTMPVPAGDWIGVKKSGWAAIWRTVDGGGFDPGLQPDADLRGERKKSPHVASFVSMVFQCLYRCSSRCYLQGAEPWTPMLSAWCPHRCKSTNVSRINPAVLVAGDLTHVALQAAAGCRQGLMTSATASSVARIAGPRTDGPILSSLSAHWFVYSSEPCAGGGSSAPSSLTSWRHTSSF
jgi:hypothetical protein